MAASRCVGAHVRRVYSSEAAGRRFAEIGAQELLSQPFRVLIAQLTEDCRR